MPTSPHDAVLERIRAEYVEMPGMSLTLGQVARLCGVELTTCQRILDALVDAKFLRVRAGGVYARVADDVRPRPRPVKVGLKSSDSVESRRRAS